MNRQDLTLYSDDELSLQVFNDEYFYNYRHEGDILISILDSMFIYTEKQLEILQSDIEDDYFNSDY